MSSPRYILAGYKTLDFSGTGTSASYVLLMPKVDGKFPAVRRVEFVGTTTMTLDFYRDTADDFSASPQLMRSFSPDGEGNLKICNWGPGADQPSLTYGFTDGKSFGFKVTQAAGSDPWRLQIEVGWLA